jgi:hypothetical protein
MFYDPNFQQILVKKNKMFDDPNILQILVKKNKMLDDPNFLQILVEKIKCSMIRIFRVRTQKQSNHDEKKLYCPKTESKKNNIMRKNMLSSTACLGQGDIGTDT